MFRGPVRVSRRQIAAALGGGLGLLAGFITVPPDWKTVYFVVCAPVVMLVCGLGAEGKARAGPEITVGNLVTKVL